MHPKDADGMANSVDPDQMDLGLHYLPRPICVENLGSLHSMEESELELFTVDTSKWQSFTRNPRYRHEWIIELDG